MSRSRSRVLPVALLVAALLSPIVPATPAAAATVGGRSVPAVWDVSPPTGGVVPAGEVWIGGSAIAPDGVHDVQLFLDGEPLRTDLPVQTPGAVRGNALATVAPGHHVAMLRFVDGSGTERRRTWRFTAVDAVTQRFAGEDRVATAARIARRNRAANAAPAAVVARADDFADALTGSPLAHHLGGPLLLTSREELSTTTAQALKDLLTEDAVVHLLGGPAALSGAVAERARALGFRVVRHEGADRFATAAAVAAALPASPEAVLASGVTFPDAVAAAGAAAQNGWPILLTAPTTLPAASRTALTDRDRVTLVGGTRVITDDVAAEVEAVAHGVRRIAGADRFQTAARVADRLTPDATVVALASGLDFADALAGSVDVARDGAALVLTGPVELPTATTEFLAARQPTTLRVYGGTRAVSDAVVNLALAAEVDDGPVVEAADPPPGAELHRLDQFRLDFDRSLDLPATNISVWFDGIEMQSSWATGDFDDTLVVTVGALPREPQVHEPIPVRLVGVVRDDDGGWRHVDRTFVFRKVAMTQGDRGSGVQALQERLVELGYWLGTPDGTFGALTTQAVMAFQKYEQLPVTGTADAATQQRLAVAQRPRGQAGRTGFVVEVDKTRQVLMFVRDGVAQWTFNTSTGTEKYYSEDGNSGLADTPPGSFRVTREYDGLRKADLGTLWRPKYFHPDGIAVHGATSVPAYPASHGCVRVTYAAMDFIWAQNLMPIGTPVVVYGRFPGT